MKTLLSLLIATIILMACNKKEQITPPPNPSVEINLQKAKGKVEIKEGILSFSSREIFDETVNYLAKCNSEQLINWQNSIGFEGILSPSLVSESGFLELPPNYNSSVTDSVFLSLLNEQGIVKIDGYYFKAEIDNGLVWAIGKHTDTSLTKVYLQQLEERIFNPAVMNRFNLAEEDAFEKLDSGYVGIDQAPLPVTEGLFGNDNKVDDDEWQTGGATWRASCKASYQAAVFYFSLVTEMKYKSGFKFAGSGPTVWSPRSTEIWFSDNLPPSTKCTYTRRRTTNQVNINEPTNSVTDNKRNWRPYSGSRSLISYDLDVRFGYISGTSSTTRFVRVRVFKP